MHMRGWQPWHWYQPVTKADANGSHGGRHLHRFWDRALIGLESRNNLCGHYGDRVLQFCKKRWGGGDRVAHKYHDIWLQNSYSRKYEEAMICAKCREPNSYMVEIPATGQCFRRNSNFIKPRQSEENSNSTHPQLTIGLPEIPQETPVLHQAAPSSQATSTVDAIPTVPPVLQNKNSTPRTPKAPRTSSRCNKGIPPTRLGLPE